MRLTSYAPTQTVLQGLWLQFVITDQLAVTLMWSFWVLAGQWPRDHDGTTTWRALTRDHRLGSATKAEIAQWVQT